MRPRVHSISLTSIIHYVLHTVPLLHFFATWQHDIGNPLEYSKLKTDSSLQKKFPEFNWKLEDKKKKEKT